MSSVARAGTPAIEHISVIVCALIGCTAPLALAARNDIGPSYQAVSSDRCCPCRRLRMMHCMFSFKRLNISAASLKPRVRNTTTALVLGSCCLHLAYCCNWCRITALSNVRSSTCWPAKSAGCTAAADPSTTPHGEICIVKGFVNCSSCASSSDSSPCCGGSTEAWGSDAGGDTVTPFSTWSCSLL